MAITRSTEGASSLRVNAQEISKRELIRYVLRTQASERAMARAERVLPLGVASTFQFYEPHPLVMQSAAGSRMRSIDGHDYVDFTLGYGACSPVTPIQRCAVWSLNNWRAELCS